VRRLCGRATAEHWTALAVGLLLAVVSILLLRKVVVTRPEVIERPLLSGLLFLAFALGSYFVFRYETAIGRQQGSIGLIADGMHSRADMIGALLAGAAMVLYSVGVDVDRPVALVISLFVLSFAVETLITTFAALARGDAEVVARMRTIQIVQAMLDRERVSGLLGRLESLAAPTAVVWVRHLGRLAVRMRWLVPAALVVAYCSTCLYSVGISERAIVLRLGRPLRAEAAVEPGLHLKLPWPLDSVIRVDADRVRRRNVGNTTDGGAFALLWTREHGSEEPFLAGDNTFFFPYLVLHYRVSDVMRFELAHANPEELLDNLAHSLISTGFAGRSFDQVVGPQRGRLEESIRTQLQRELDLLGVGIEVLGIHFRDVHPPIFIADAYERVIAARQEKEQLINDAIGYRNSRLPEARGDAVRSVEGARGYVTDRVERARGDGARFRARVVRQSARRKVTARRLYLETMAEALAGAGTILVDPDSGSPTLFLGGSDGQLQSKGIGSLYLGSEEPAADRRRDDGGGSR
jgi:membrane protease subunit HflK